MKQTILLDRNKTIDVGKIIQNEELLHQENVLLKQAIENLENALKESQAQIDLLRGEYRQAQLRIQQLQDEIIDDNQELLAIEKSKKNFGVYGYGEVGTTASELDYNHLFIGAQLVREKMLYSLSVNPVNTTPIYAIGVGFKIF